MALSIKDPETEKLARALAARTGETITIATRRALEDRLKRMGSHAGKDALLEDMAAMQRRLRLSLKCQALRLSLPRKPVMRVVWRKPCAMI